MESPLLNDTRDRGLRLGKSYYSTAIEPIVRSSKREQPVDKKDQIYYKYPGDMKTLTCKLQGDNFATYVV